MTYSKVLAFPVHEGATHLGLTKREYIATAALQGILASSPRYESLAQAAVDAVKAADLLIAELNK